MTTMIRCKNCGELVPANNRIKNQRYCKKEACQRARKAEWQRKKLATDPDYWFNQRDCQRKWRKAHPGYYRDYRKRKPDYTKRNRKRQRDRDRMKNGGDLAKMDALNSKGNNDLKAYYLHPHLAKMDASDTGKPCSIIEIEEFTLPGPLAKMDTIGRHLILIPIS